MSAIGVEHLNGLALFYIPKNIPINIRNIILCSNKQKNRPILLFLINKTILLFVIFIYL